MIACACNPCRSPDVRIPRRLAVIAHDLVMIGVAWLLALWARFNFEAPPQEFVDANLMALPLVVLLQGAVARWFGLYRGLWRFASLPDLWNIIRAAAIGAVFIGAALFIANRLVGIPRSMLVLYPLFLIFLLGGPRLAYRLWKDHSFGLAQISGGARVIVIGAGSGGENVVRDMLREGSYLPVGLVDDNTDLRRSRIHGIPVLGAVSELPALVSELDVDMLVIAMPSASSATMRHLVAVCESTGKPFRTLPHLKDLVSGRVSVQSLREVSIDDLLGRDKVVLDWEGIHGAVTGKTVLVSGGGGSIGSELCRQVAALGAARLLIMDRSEHNLYLIERELSAAYPRFSFHCVLGDVCDPVALERVFSRHRPALVFHAAAYKHVPILQNQAAEAVRNNVFGTLAIIEAAERHGCASFVLISTDKAVRPSNVMGATKRLAELVCENRNRVSDTRFITVRFGNVLGSAGSVVPLFREQIAAGGPVTVTHPDATRYFMTIPEASQLILQATALGQGGEIFVLDMGEPVNITYLARQLIQLSGREPDRDIEIRYTGLRPGEKLREELFHDHETLTPTDHDKLWRAAHSGVDVSSLDSALVELREAHASGDDAGVAEVLQRLIPVFEEDTTPAEDNVVELARNSS